MLDDLCRLRFIHTTSHTPPTFESNFIVSRLGAYIVRYFLPDMMLLENVMMDTFIPDEERWNFLRNQSGAIYVERNIVQRLNLRRARVLAFYDYMAELFTPLRDESSRRGFSAV